MNEDDYKEKYSEKLFNSYISGSAASYILSTDEGVYYEIKANKFFHNMLGTTGELYELFRNLFMKNRIDTGKTENNYDIFIDTSLFRKQFYMGKMEIECDDEWKEYMFQLVRVSESESVIYFFSDFISYSSEKVDMEKLETIQENYLFSMIVDLKNDTCKNSVTTEVRINRQDFLKIKYSQWRYMIANMFLPDDKSMFLQMSDPEYLMEYLLKNKALKFEIQMKNMQGQYIWTRLMFHRKKGFSRENPIFLYTVQDIEEDMERLLRQENIIAAVEAKNEQLKSINKAKNVFISNMSHEIRTPINAVIGMNEMILRETADKNVLGYAKNVKNAAGMLLSVINDILDFSKIESGKMEIIPVEYEIFSLVKDVVNMLSIKIKEKNLLFKLKVDTKIPPVLFGDDIRIRQVIINLLTNAVKYTYEGSVTLEVKQEYVDGEQIGIRVEVSDTGIGMKKEEMSKLFVAFERLEENRNRAVEGAGLGLSIVVKLLEQMDSKLEVESEYGKGSVFAFTLPQKIVKREGTAEVQSDIEKNYDYEKQIVAPKAKVLVVDDNMVNLEVMRGLLKNTEVEVDTALNGKECIEKVQAKDYDIIFMDHLMPVMDGIEAVDRIRNMGGRYENIPVIALTANVMSDAQTRYKNAGFTDFLEKPVIVEKLEGVLRDYLPKELIEL